MILRLLELLLLCVCTGALSHFFQMTMEKGMIFRSYAYWIKYLFDYKGRPKRISWKYTDQRKKWYVMHKEKRKWYFFFYFPLGGCVMCNGTWVFIIVFLTLYLPVSLTDIILLALGCGVNYLSILLISKIK